MMAYGCLAFCLSFVGLPIYIYLPNYYHDNFGIELTTLSAILLITRLVDTVQDPIIGYFSEKTVHKKKLIVFTCPLLGLAFLWLFSPSEAIIESDYLDLTLALILILTYTLFSLVYINYQAFSVGFTEDFHAKTRIIAWRESFFIGGILCAVLLPTLLYRITTEVNAFFYVGLAYAGLISLLAIIFYYFAPNLPKPPSQQLIRANHQQQQQSLLLTLTDLLKAFKSVFKQPSLRRYFIIYFACAISSAIPAALILFFVDRVLQAEAYVGLFLVLYFVGLLLGVPIWTKVSQKLNDKVKSWRLSMFLTVFIFAWCYGLSAGDLLAYGFICLFSGMAFAGDLALSLSILTDMIQRFQWQKQQTIIFSVTNFLTKLALTLTSAGLIYMIGMTEDNPYQQHYISLSYAILPLGFRLIAAWLTVKNHHHFHPVNLSHTNSNHTNP